VTYVHIVCPHVISGVGRQSGAISCRMPQYESLLNMGDIQYDIDPIPGQLFAVTVDVYLTVILPSLASRH